MDDDGEECENTKRLVNRIEAEHELGIIKGVFNFHFCGQKMAKKRPRLQINRVNRYPWELSLERFKKSRSHPVKKKVSGLFGVWLRFGSVTGFFEPAPSPKPRQNPKMDSLVPTRSALKGLRPEDGTNSFRRFPSGSNHAPEGHNIS